MAEASYPDDLKYHAEHDWARDRRRHRHAGHHLVRAGPARRGRVLRPARGRHDDRPRTAVRRGRVGQGRLRRRRAAVAARSSRSTRRSATRRSRSTRTPTAKAGWSRSGSPTPSEVDDLMDADGLRGLLLSAQYEPLHLRHRRRPAGDARRASASSRSTSCSPTSRRACGSAARSTCPPGKPEQEVYAHLRDLAAPQRLRRGRDLVPRRRDVRPLRPGADRLDPARARSS